MVRRGDDSFGDEGDGDKAKKERPSTPAPIAEVGDNESQEEFTPVLISSFLVSRFQQEVGDTPSELVLTPTAVAYAQSVSENVDDVDATAEDDGSELGAAAPPIPPQSLRRQPTPEEAERYAEVARQLNEVARQIETQYSNDLDEMVDSLNLVTEVAYDAFAAVARTIIARGITWSRVLVLILFGWRVMKKVYLTWSASGIVQRILDYLIKFITDYVLSWITDHGGWMNLLRNPPTTPSPTTDGGHSNPFLPTDVLAQFTVERALTAAAVGACAVLAYLYLNRRN